MKKLIILCYLLVIPGLFAKLPVFTINHEVGSRYAIQTFEEEDFNSIVFDGYRFNKGYAQVNETFSPILNFRFKFYYNVKDYDTATNLNNNTYSYIPFLSFGVIPGMKLNVSLKWTSRDYLIGNKDFEALTPGLEFRYNPIKYLHLGLKYNFVSLNYISSDGDYSGNRGSIWYEQRIISKMNIRARYRIENRSYAVPTNQRSNSFKHSFSATIKIDLNR